jgi:hypothetical protein
MNNPALKYMIDYVFGKPERLPPLPRTRLDALTEIQIEKALRGDTPAFMAICQLIEFYDPTTENAFDSEEDT